ncbi:MAG: hypothetical protein JSV86_08740 [Gemmatimonadota bacterium]|nr:MAG: hypothetical protein JSV86_08740 [Gemmatimonadota bacterium]
MSLKVSRATVDKAIALAGVALVVVQLLLLAYSPYHVAFVVLGVLLIYVGIWRLFSHWLPDRRVYTPLRAEVDTFIRLVRKLNAQRARGDATAAFETAAELRESTERVIDAAGVEAKEESRGGVDAELHRQVLGSS